MAVQVARGAAGAAPRAVLFCAAAAALAALVILVRHAGAYFFLFDDFTLLHQATTSSVAQLVGADVFGFYRPLVYLLLKLEFKAFGWQHPWGYAAAAAVWHCANALLVGGVARRLGATRAGAAVGATLFLLSPWSAETYFWASAHFDLVCGFGVLASVFCALSLETAPSVGRRALWLVAGCGCALVAVCAKENGVVLPALLLAVVGVSRPRALRDAWFLLYLAASVGAIAAYLWVREAVLPGLAGSYGGASALFGRADLVHNVASYLRAFLTFPSDRAALGHWPPPAIVALLAIGYALAGLSVSARGWRLVSAVLLSFFIGLAPVAWSSMLPGSSAAGRLLYLPAAWVMLLASLGVDDSNMRSGSAAGTTSWRARAGQVGVIVLLALFVPSLLSQSRTWRIASGVSHAAIGQFERVLDRGIASVYIPNLPFWFAEGPYALKSDAFADYYGSRHQVPVVTAREMVVTAHGGDLRFAGWVEESLRSTTAPPAGPVLELRLGMSDVWSSLVAPGRISVFARAGRPAATPGHVSLEVPSDTAWSIDLPPASPYSISPGSGVGPVSLTLTPQTCTRAAQAESEAVVRLAGGEAAIKLLVRYRCVVEPGRPPFGFMEVPPRGATVPVDQAVLFQGWVLDELDIRRVWLEGIDPSGRRVPLGDAKRDGFRPDVAAHFPEAYDVYNDAWALVVPAEALKRLSRPGFVVALAEDGDGNRTELGRRAIR